MDDENPYRPPKSRGGVDIGPAAIGVVASRFSFTPDHFAETLERYRSHHKGERLWRWFRLLIGAFLLSVAIAFLVASIHVASAFLLLLAVLVFFPHKIGDFFTRRSFRSSPHCNQEQAIRLSHDRVVVESNVEKAELQWQAFSKAVFFPDGVLLFRGSKIINWIPDASLESAGGPQRIRQLLRAKLPTEHGGEWRRRPATS